MVGICECGNEPSVSIECGEFLVEQVSFSRRTLPHGVGYLSEAQWIVSMYV